jgi:phosphoribosylanthranilate isomerase
MPVGVFVQADIQEIATLYKHDIIGMAQLHGGESEEYILTLRELCDIPIIKAIRADSQEDVIKGKLTMADFILLDSGAGGTGHRFDWTLAKEVDRSFFLAGGITTDNIMDAIALHPYAIDVSSGAETKGLKDRDKIVELVKKVRSER